MQALSVMNRTGNARFMVVENGRLVGVLSLKEMLELMSLKVELEE
jgi:CBS domain-containing protein